MDELEIQGKKYISSKRASELTGYAKDYIGQLARSGKIAGTRMGRAWYIETEALLKHASLDTAVSHPSQNAGEPKSEPVLSPIQKKPISPSTLRALGYTPTVLPRTWTPVSYAHEEFNLIPSPSREKASEKVKEISEPDTKAPQEALESMVRIHILKTKTAPVSFQKPQRERVVASSTAIRRKRIHPRTSLSLGALAAALGLFIFFSSGFFLSSEISMSAKNASYSANIFIGAEYVRDFLSQYPPFQAGAHAIGGFFHLLTGSFAAFFNQGVSFFKTLFDILLVQ